MLTHTAAQRSRRYTSRFSQRCRNGSDQSPHGTSFIQDVALCRRIFRLTLFSGVCDCAGGRLSALLVRQRFRTQADRSCGEPGSRRSSHLRRRLRSRRARLEISLYCGHVVQSRLGCGCGCGCGLDDGTRGAKVDVANTAEEENSASAPTFACVEFGSRCDDRRSYSKI